MSRAGPPRRLPALLLLGATILTGTTDRVSGQTSACTLDSRQTEWIQTSLNAWEEVTREVLRMPSDELPWIILFDTRCVWHLAPATSADRTPVESVLTFAGGPVPVEMRSHDGQLTLPDEREIPAAPLAFTGLPEGDTVTYSVASLPELWRTIPGFEEEMGDVGAFARGILIHELVHTRQLVPIARRIEQLQSRHELPEEIDDDMIQRRYEEVPGYRAAYRAERDLLYEAMAAPGAARRRELLARAVTMIRERRKRYFVGPDSVYAELEDLFLLLEGAAVWAHHTLHVKKPELVSFVRTSQEPAWTQDEGYALFVLLDAFVPDWRDRIFADDPASPVGLLEDALEL